MRDASKLQTNTSTIDYTSTRFHTCIPTSVPKPGNALASTENVQAVMNAQRQLANQMERERIAA